MILTISGKPQVTIHPGRESPGTGYHQFLESDYWTITAKDLSDNNIKQWERNRYDFTMADSITVTGGLAGGGDTPTRIVATGAGTISAGAKYVEVSNVGGATGTLMGGNIVNGSKNTISAAEGTVLDTEISYDATGTTFEIIVVR